MRIESQFNQLVNNPTLTSTLSNALQKLALALMCVRVGIVQEFFPDDLTADVLIVNKITTGLNQDGSQVVKDWGKIRAKVCYCSPYDTFPINTGDECVLLFSDRELESWFINGTSSPIAHSRMHDETDCIAIFGIRSLPNMIQILLDGRHIFYGNSDIQLKENDIFSNTQNLKLNAETSIQINTTNFELNSNISGITSDLNITGNTIQTGTITADGLNDTTAASGTFISKDEKTITVVNGIITAISQ